MFLIRFLSRHDYV